MDINAVTLKRLVAAELSKLGNAQVENYVRGVLSEPTPAFRDWDYGERGQQFTCWTVLEHPASNSSIAYCEEGFGPTHPWGLLFLTGEHMSMGMDSGWFRTFTEAFFDSMAATCLPIWRVFKTDASGTREAISGEGTWDGTWREVEAYRRTDASARYDCDTSIKYARE
jgi:hypothetical protein